MQIPAEKIIRLTDPDHPSEVRCAAVTILGELGGRNADVNAAVLEALASDDGAVRVRAVRAAGQLKIDKAFVAEMDTRADDASIVQAIVSLAHGLKLKVVAEGVETAAQLEALQALGCDEYQGFYCSPALPAHEFEMLMRIKAAEPRPAATAKIEETASKLTAIRRR